jgi:hypothetical protein
VPKEKGAKQEIQEIPQGMRSVLHALRLVPQAVQPVLHESDILSGPFWPVTKFPKFHKNDKRLLKWYNDVMEIKLIVPCFSVCSQLRALKSKGMK